MYYWAHDHEVRLVARWGEETSARAKGYREEYFEMS